MNLVEPQSSGSLTLSSSRRLLLIAAMVLMGLIGVIWLSYQFWRLLWQPEPLGAIDLGLRYTEVHSWFAGEKVYGKVDSAVYPPATYVILWPFLGWLPWTGARWLWAITTVIGTTSLVYLSGRHSLASTSLQKACVAIIPLSMYATGAAIGNGQTLLHILPALITAILLLDRDVSLLRDVAAAALFLFSLVKPNVVTPFFWIVIVRPGRWRPALLVLVGYLMLTFFAAAYQPGNLVALLRDWTARAQASVDYTREAVRDSQIGLDAPQAVKERTVSDLIPSLTPLVSILILVASGLWFYKFRRVDIWLMLAVAAFVARFWTYHRWYDDLLLLIPAISLFRIGMQQGHKGVGTTAHVLMVLLTLSLLAPGGLYTLSGTLKAIYLNAQLFVWISVLLFLLWFAWRYQSSLSKDREELTRAQ